MIIHDVIIIIIFRQRTGTCNFLKNVAGTYNQLGETKSVNLDTDINNGLKGNKIQKPVKIHISLKPGDSQPYLMCVIIAVFIDMIS